MSGLWQLISRFTRLFVWWVTVNPWESALRVRFGKHVTLLKPGIRLKIPYIDQVYKQSSRLRASSLQMQTLTTKDNKTLTTSGVIAYTIEDITLLYSTLHHAEDTIVNLAMSAVAQYVHTHNAEECLPQMVETSVANDMNLSKFGLGHVTMQLTDFAYVRTFRLISDSKWGHSGDHLDTTRPQSDNSGPY